MDSIEDESSFIAYKPRKRNRHNNNESKQDYNAHQLLKPPETLNHFSSLAIESAGSKTSGKKKRSRTHKKRIEKPIDEMLNIPVNGNNQNELFNYQGENDKKDGYIGKSLLNIPESVQVHSHPTIESADPPKTSRMEKNFNTSDTEMNKLIVKFSNITIENKQQELINYGEELIGLSSVDQPTEWADYSSGSKVYAKEKYYGTSMSKLINKKNLQNKKKQNHKDDHQSEGKGTAAPSLNLKRYWKKRFQLFSLYNRGIILDEESWYSVTPEPIARQIALRMEAALNRRPTANASEHRQSLIIVDGFCGAGGNAIQFALLPTVRKVIAVDISSNKIKLAKNNAIVYGCRNKIQFIRANFLILMKTIYGKNLMRKADACFLSPSWGGPSYLEKENYTLDCMTPNGLKVAGLVGEHLTKNVSFLLPRNFNLSQLKSLAQAISGSDTFKCEIEGNRMRRDSFVKMYTAYFGDLVN